MGAMTPYAMVKALIGDLGLVILLSAVTPVMAASDAYNDGYRQGINDYIHKHGVLLSEYNDNPTHNPNITDYINGYVQASNDAFDGPWSGAHFDKKGFDYADGWFAGANALAHNLTAISMEHVSSSYNLGWVDGRYPPNP